MLHMGALNNIVPGFVEPKFSLIYITDYLLKQR